MRGGLPWGKPSSDIHTSPTCRESATQSLSAPGPLSAGPGARAEVGVGVGGVWSQRAPRHTLGRRGEVTKLSPSPRAQVSPTHGSRLPGLALLGS